MAIAGAGAVAASVAAADDNHILALGGELIGQVVALVDFVLLREELHRVVDTLEVAARDVEVARLSRAAAEQDRVVVIDKFLGRHIAADVAVAAELDPFGSELIDGAARRAIFRV